MSTRDLPPVPGCVWTETCRDDSVAPLRPIEMRGKTWGIRERGDTSGQVLHVYRCPVHGEFEALVPRASVPDEMPCSSEEWENPDFPYEEVELELAESPYCGLASPWAGSRCGIGKSAGEVTG